MGKDIVSTTRPTDEGEMLWCVHYASSYYDSDPRGSGWVSVDERCFVLARGQEEAIKKSAEAINRGRRRSDKGAGEKITATIVTIEDLVPARDRSGDNLHGGYLIAKLEAITLTCKEDSDRYRLAVCLIPK